MLQKILIGLILSFYFSISHGITQPNWPVPPMEELLNDFIKEKGSRFTLASQTSGQCPESIDLVTKGRTISMVDSTSKDIFISFDKIDIEYVYAENANHIWMGRHFFSNPYNQNSPAYLGKEYQACKKPKRYGSCFNWETQLRATFLRSKLEITDQINKIECVYNRK